MTKPTFPLLQDSLTPEQYQANIDYCNEMKDRMQRTLDGLKKMEEQRNGMFKSYPSPITFGSEVADACHDEVNDIPQKYRDELNRMSPKQRRKFLEGEWNPE